MYKEYEEKVAAIRPSVVSANSIVYQHMFTLIYTFSI